VKSLEKNHGWMVAGFDTSSSSIAGAAIAYDKTLNKMRGPVFCSVRWSKNDHYFSRISSASKSASLVWDMQAEMNLSMRPDEVYIAQEEPWPIGMVGRGVSQGLKQQAEISGAFLGGLVRFNFDNIAQIHSIQWRTMIAHDLGITTHYTKWKDPALCAIYNCTPDDTGKFRSKQWADMMFGDLIPEWPDIIKHSTGSIPRPEGSKAKAFQPDDRYDALAICWAFCHELAQDVLRDGIVEVLKENTQVPIPPAKVIRVKKALGLK